MRIGPFLILIFSLGVGPAWGQAVIRNQATAQADGQTRPSNPVETRVSLSLLLSKEVDRKEASVGDRLVYTLTLVNPGQAPLLVDLEDQPPAGTRYVPGTAAPAEPSLEGNKLRWQGLRLGVGPGQDRLVLSYALQVLPGAPERLVNIATATAAREGQGAQARAVLSATAVVKLQQGVFAPPHNLLGRVFLDADRDGRYTAGLDVPLPGARVLLSNGLQTLTDGEGRYSFRNLVGGLWEVMLEPASAPFRPLPHPEALGDGYRHRVRVEGLTTSDFPLEYPAGLARAQRETTLEFGPLKVEKKLLPLPGGVRVVLVLRSAETLTDLTLTDPLPEGGERVFRFEQFQGETTLTYDLPGGPLTDPQVRWRYP
ncbi:hypothetical protein Mlute_00534 [Meiothermus luteus]|jgi:uncharacterized repeat protein (TIGR01451 family)|uniref:DUF11 domain-containing protein n=1 Tax=Meiothermus luteus TaxID=2026184 RepID=A0A399EZB7_9DEIN|nr:hypothetical protein [Meiothermus luteus]RIH88746.1 hypothetical protein Mlute_00534 [Meiothermus luteus]